MSTVSSPADHAAAIRDALKLLVDIDDGAMESGNEALIEMLLSRPNASGDVALIALAALVAQASLDAKRAEAAREALRVYDNAFVDLYAALTPDGYEQGDSGFEMEARVVLSDVGLYMRMARESRDALAGGDSR